jgi:hypothetical protein
MDISFQSVIMALALLIATVFTVLIEKLRKENRRDHGYVRDRLDGIHADVKEVNNRLDKHIDWHMAGTLQPDPPKRTRKRAPRSTSGQS